MLKFSFGAFLAMVAIVIFTNDPQPDYDRMMERTLKITTEHSKGSGFFSDSGYVISAAHVVAGNKGKILGKTKDGQQYELEIEKIIPEKDLVFLKSTKKSLKTAKLTCQPVKTGQKIVAVGNPAFLDWITSFGTVASPRQPRMPELENLDVFIADITLAPGMSGGPVFDVYGDVVGINDAIVTTDTKQTTDFGLSLKINTWTGFSVVVTGEAICDELKKLPKLK